MNIFHLERGSIANAMSHCDKHVVKMILEYAQLLSTTNHLINEEITESVKQKIYRVTHVNHPCAKWVRTNSGNYEYLLNLLHSLLAEYTYRYGKQHQTQSVFKVLADEVNWRDFNYRSPTLDPPLCMPDDCKPIVTFIGDDGIIRPNTRLESASIGTSQLIEAYRTYYKKYKLPLATYTKRSRPEWLPERDVTDLLP